MADRDHGLSPLSRKDKARSSSCLPHCCFHHHTAAKSRTYRNSSHFKGKCSDFISRIGSRQGRRQSADFHYDALSYAMNFEDHADSNDERYVGDVTRRDFVARLPASPLSTRISSDSSRSREVAAVS
ncbi:uncharacterized protein LOC129321019 [Prosopis cineraria]|uniref:uncharacterized protein LOC129321019 n=1 Tax=Prosopis cineraria TaxID=364024 RepID=UPI00240EBB15|nr:uncharacterized protein LOC129321019 [Prosopis cineraria]